MIGGRQPIVDRGVSSIDRVGLLPRDLAGGNGPRYVWHDLGVELPSPRSVAVVSDGEVDAPVVHNAALD